MHRLSMTILTILLTSASKSSLTSASSSDWWYFDAWDGLSCGNAPQNGQFILTTEGTGNQVCISLDPNVRAFSYASAFGQEDTVVRGFLYEHCAGPSKVLMNNTCTNPDKEIPFIRSWRVVTGGEDMDG